MAGNKKKWIYSALFITLFLNQLIANDDPTVATVNGVEIKKSQLDRAYEESRMFVGTNLVSRERVLYDMINRKLGIERAKENNLQDDPIVSSKMQDILYHAQISKDLEDKLTKIEVSDQDVRRYYNNNKEYRTAHILFRMQANPEEAEKEAALRKALEVYNRLKVNPEQFSELANKYSQSSTAPAGGDLGFQPAARLAPEYNRAIQGRQANEILAPVRTQFGYHIIKILAEKKFDEINMPLYKKLVYDEKRDAILADYYESLRQDAEISINEELL